MNATIADMSGDAPAFEGTKAMLANFVALQAYMASKATAVVELLGDCAKQGLAFTKCC